MNSVTQFPPYPPYIYTKRNIVLLDIKGYPIGADFRGGLRHVALQALQNKAKSALHNVTALQKQGIVTSVTRS